MEGEGETVRVVERGARTWGESSEFAWAEKIGRYRLQNFLRRSSFCPPTAVRELALSHYGSAVNARGEVPESQVYNAIPRERRETGGTRSGPEGHTGCTLGAQ